MQSTSNQNQTKSSFDEVKTESSVKIDAKIIERNLQQQKGMESNILDSNESISGTDYSESENTDESENESDSYTEHESSSQNQSNPSIKRINSNILLEDQSRKKFQSGKKF